MRRETWLPKQIWLLWKSRTILWPMQTAMCWLTSPASLRCWLESTFPLLRVKTHLDRGDFDIYIFLFSLVTVCVDIWTTLTDILLPLKPPVCWVNVRAQINHIDLDNICFWLSVQGSWLDPTALEICVMPRSQFPLEPLQPSPPPPLFVSFFTASCRSIADAHQSQIYFSFLRNLRCENTCLLSFLSILKPINLWPHWSWVRIYRNNCKLSCQLGHDKTPFLKQIPCGILQCLVERWFIFPESSKNIFPTSLELRPCLQWFPMISKKEQWRWHSTVANIESRYTAVSLNLKM